MKDAITWTLIGLAFFASIFGAYQIFIDDAFASEYDQCGNATSECDRWGKECSARYECRCQGGPVLFYCWPGTPN